MTDIRIGSLPQAPAGTIRTAKSGPSGDFGSLIGQAVKKVDAMEKDADRSIVNLLQGKADVHETMIALQKADLSMRMLLTVRNKVIEAYREIMRMQF